MKHVLLAMLLATISLNNLHAQNTVIIPDYKNAAFRPGVNYYQLVADVRAKLQQKKQQLAAQGTTTATSQRLREDIAQFERWAYNYSFKIGPDGKFPNPAAGWINARQSNPELLDKNISGPLTHRTNAAGWTSIGPFDSAFSNGWTYGAGIGRINVIRQHPTNKNVLFAGSAAGGIFRSANLGASWVPVTDQFAGLGVSDLVIDANNPSVMYMATGDYDAAHISSIGVYKSTDGGLNWAATGLTFSLSEQSFIAHIYIDPENSNTIYATGTFEVHRSTDGGTTWGQVLSPGTNERFNDIIKVVSGGIKRVFVTNKVGKLYRSEDDGANFTLVHTYTGGRLDFAFSPANPNVLMLLGEVNPAFSKYTISTNTVATFTNITNANPADDNANFNTQQGYNQVIAVSPTNADSIWVGEFSGKLSTNGGSTWQNKLNGYYETSGNASWGGFYVHSDNHCFEFIGSDTLLVGNDGGVYVGKISANDFKQRFNGLVTTQSYSMALYDAEPDNLMLGNQDNDGSSRIGVGANAKFYGAQAGDGTATAIGRTNSNTRYVGGTNGKLSYRTDGYAPDYRGNGITTPAGAPFVWDMQMHATDETILYGGFADVHKMTGAPTGSFTALNAGAATHIKTISLANNTATTSKIIIIDSANNVRKSSDEITWSTITKPAGVNFVSIYAKKTDWNILVAAASGYNAANKVFYSADNGATWANVTKNLPNIMMKKIMMYEGTDTIFLATELGVFFSRISALTSTAPSGNEWAKYGGTTLPNVRVEDMEISYTKKQLYAATFGRGIWVTDISTAVILPLNNIHFTYKSTGSNRYSLSWKIDMPEIAATTLEKSTDAIHFSAVSVFSDSRKVRTDAWPVTLTADVEYYRLKCVKTNGAVFYSNIIRISSNGEMQVSVYPNPVQGYVFVNSRQKIQTVIIYNMAGVQYTYAKPGSNFYYFDMSLLPAGTYLVKIEDEKGNVVTEKVIRAGK